MWTESDGKPGTTYSTGVSNCVVASTAVTITMATTTAPDFYVVVHRSKAYAISATTNLITGTLSNYATEVQVMSAVTAAKVYLAKGATPAGGTTTTLVVSKTIHNTMDTGTV